MDFFTLIQNFLAKAFGVAFELPGQLLLVSKERLGVPIGAVLKKDFEFFGISLSLDVEYNLLKRKLLFDISASKTFEIFGLEIIPTIIVGKYGVAATLEVGANNYYVNAGIGFDRIPGVSFGARRGSTGFDISFGGGFPDEFQIYDKYKTFTVPLGIDFRGRNKDLARITENSSYNTIDYVDTGSGVLVPINNKLVPFKGAIARRNLNVETSGGLVAESFGFGRRAVRSNSGNEANRQAIEQIIKSQGGIAGDIVYFLPGADIRIKGDEHDLDKAYSEMSNFLVTQKVEFLDANTIYSKLRFSDGAVNGLYQSQERPNSPSLMYVYQAQSKDPLFAKARAVATLYHETTHFLQNAVGLHRGGDITQVIGIHPDDLYQKGLDVLKYKNYSPDKYPIEAEAFATEFNLGSLELAISRTQTITGVIYRDIPTFFAESSSLSGGGTFGHYFGSDRAYYYSSLREYEDFSTLVKAIHPKDRQRPPFYHRNLSDVLKHLASSGYIEPALRAAYPGRFDIYDVSPPSSPSAISSLPRPNSPSVISSLPRPNSPSAISSLPRPNSIPYPPIPLPESLKHFGFTSADAGFAPPKVLSATQLADFVRWRSAVEQRDMALAGISYSRSPSQLPLSRGTNNASSFFDRASYASRYMGDSFSIRRSKF